MKEFYIIRHGETDLNKLGIVQGRGVDTDLNETGRAQAKAFFERYRDVKFDRIYTSTLKRTHQTVASFIDLGLPWQQLEGLDELAWGEWEGKENTEVSRHAFKILAEDWQAGLYDSKFENGESPNDVQKRQIEAMKIINSQENDRCVLICMHGRAMRLLLCYLLDKPMSEMADFPHSNTTLYRLSFDDGRYAILDFNNIDHLDQV